MASLHFTPTPNPNLSHFKSKNPTKPLKITQANLPNTHENPPNHHPLNKSYFHRVFSLCKDGQIQEAVDLVTDMESNDLRIGPEFYGELLQGCVYKRALFTGQQIHARILKSGDSFARNQYIETKLVIFYAKCDAWDVANLLFRRLRMQNVFSWAAIIGLKCRMGVNEEALLDFCEMQENGLLPDNFIAPNALKACGALRWVGFGKGVHGYVVKLGFNDCVYVASSLVDMYGKCGVLEDARKVFDYMLERNVIAWNSMIVGYVQNGMNEEAIKVFYDMRVEGIELTRVTLSSFLSASANSDAVEEGKQGHAMAVLGGLEMDNILGSSIINFYSKVGLIEDAEAVFSRILEKDVVTWNLLISGYVQHGQVEKALNTCRLMRSEDLRFDCVTLASILAAAADTGNIKLGKEGHCYCIRNNLETDVVVASSLVNMYAKCSGIDKARRVFDSTTHRDIVLWNTLLAAYAEFGMSGEALKFFYQMQLESVPPNVISWNSVILGFLRNFQFSEAMDMVSQMQSLGINPNLITWTTLINGLAQQGLHDNAIQFFRKMQESGIKPNAISVIGALSACTDVASLHYGKSVHGYMTRHNLCHSTPVSTSLVDMYAKCGSIGRGYMTRHNLCYSTPVSTSLVDMYAKCGSIGQAKKVFDTILIKELPLYNAMISAYALHGQAEEALALYKHLHESGIEPDSITFTNILSACNHADMVKEGLELFVQMVSKYSIKPTIEHYGCVVNLLSRHGNLNEVLMFVHEMPYELDEHIIGSLIAACKEQHEFQLGEHLSNHLLKLGPGNSGNYVALSNTYAAAGKWSEVLKLRDLMKERGLRKNPGCSWIHIGEELHVFMAGDGSHPKTEEIYSTLTLLRREMCFNTEILL